RVPMIENFFLGQIGCVGHDGELDSDCSSGLVSSFLGMNYTPMSINNTPADGKSEPRTPGLSGKERIKDSCPYGFRYSRAAVGYLRDHPCRASQFLTRNLDYYPSSRTHCFNCV